MVNKVKFKNNGEYPEIDDPPTVVILIPVCKPYKI